MNISIQGIRSNSYGNNQPKSVYAGNLPLMQKPALKSTQEKAERQQKAAGQIDYWEKQKANLKNTECSTIEEIAQKLEKLHTYEDEITAAKMAYNNEQMRHVMDEAKEWGEKIAEKVEELEPKTPEERRKEMVEEALGTDEEKGVLTECLEEMQEELAEMTEELTEKLMEEIAEERNGETAEKISEELMENNAEQLQNLPPVKRRIDVLI